MRSPVRALIPVGLVAAAILATACTPPPNQPINPGSSTTAPTGPTTTATTTTTVVTRPPHLYSENPIDSWGQDGIAYSVDIQGQRGLRRWRLLARRARASSRWRGPT